MTDMYLLATVRMKELAREAEVARRGRAAIPRPVGRPRIMLARWLLALAARLWPEAGRHYVMGGSR
jgi:hypothetical protein